MFGIGSVEAGLGVVLLVVLAVLVGLGRRDDLRPAREWRLVRATRVVGVLTAVVLATVTLNRGELGMGQMLAPSVFGLVVLAAVTIGETMVRPRRPAGRRTASLAARRVRDYLPRPTTIAVAATGAVLAGTLLFTTLTAGADDGGRMRQLTCSGPTVAAATGPYPGAYYSLPLAVVLAVVLLVAVLAAHQVVRRPRGLADTDRGDDVLRKRSLTVIVAATGVAVTLSHVGVAVVSVNALLGLDRCAPGWAAPAGWVIGLTAVPAFFLALWCLVRVVSNDTLERPWS